MQGFLGRIAIRREMGIERLAIRCGAAGVERLAVRALWIHPLEAFAVLHPFLLASSGDVVYLFCNVNSGVTQ